MFMSKFASRRRGFTLIELLIVIVVIAILALIVIPRLMGAARKAKESALKSDLQQLRNAIGQFQGDTGFYPYSLADLVKAQSATAEGADSAGAKVTGTDAALIDNAYKGPYLTPSGGLAGAPGIPANPFDTAATKTLATSWDYTPGTGIVKSMIPGTTLDQEDFQSL